MDSLGARIKHFRLKAGLSKAALARYIGVSDVTVSYWESGTIKQIGHARLVALAEALGCPLAALLEGSANTPLATLSHAGPLPWEQRRVTPMAIEPVMLDMPWEGNAFLATPASGSSFAPLRPGDLALFGPTTDFQHAGHYLIRQQETLSLVHLADPAAATALLHGVLLAHWGRQ